MALPDTHRRRLSVTPEWDYLLNQGPHGGDFNWGDHRYFTSHLQLLRQSIADQVGADPEFGARLRVAALEALETGDTEYIRRAIQVLSVAGLAEDQARISLFLPHPDEAVGKDARSCLFEMKMRSR